MTQRKWSAFKVGDYVLLTGKEGYIRYIGERLHHHGTWYGIELIIGNGRHTGSEYGKKYFHCKHKSGIFVQFQAIKCKLSKVPKTNNNNIRNDKKHVRKRKSSRNKSSIKFKAPSKSLLKSPKQKHKMSRSISPISHSQKNKVIIKSRVKSNANILKIPRTTSLRSKSHANIAAKPTPKPKRKRVKPKPPPKKTSKFKSNPYTQERMHLKNSKSIPHDTSHATLNKSQTARLTLSKSSSTSLRKKKKKKREDSNIKPSSYMNMKHKKKRSDTYEKRIRAKKKKKKEKHIASRSVGCNNDADKKQIFDLEAILHDNQAGKSQKKVRKKYAKFNKLPTCNKLEIRKASSFNGADDHDKKKGRKYRMREGIQDEVTSEWRPRSHSDNSMVFAVTNEEEEDDGDDDEWECEKCFRMNIMEFNFCPICGVKRALHTVKKIAISLDLDLKQGSDSDEMSESDHSDGLDQYILDEEKEMESILDDMKYENNVKMEKIYREREELDGLKKEDFIKTFDTMNVNIENIKHKKSNSSSDTPSPPATNIISPKFKIKKPKFIKNWILSPKGNKSPKPKPNGVKYETDTNYDNVMKTMGITNKYNDNNNINNNNNNNNMVYNNRGYEDSVSYSDISYAYSVGGRNDSDRLNNIKTTANYRQSLDLIPDTPRSNISEFDTPHYNQNNKITVYPYTFNKSDIENHEKNNSNDVGGAISSDDKKRKHRKQKPKNAKKKKKKNSHKKYATYYDENE